MLGKNIISIFILSLAIALSSCCHENTLYIDATTSAFDSVGVSNSKQMYRKICGHYYCDSIDMTIWLYEDGSYTEHNKWGWFDGYYEYERPLDDKDFFYIRTMERYPIGRDQAITNIRFAYQKNNTTLNDRFFVFDRGGLLVNTRAFYWVDSLGREVFEQVTCNRHLIPSEAENISITDLSVNNSKKVPIKKGYNIIFFFRPNYGSCNLRWDESKGLYYVSNNGKEFIFKKRRLIGILKTSPPIIEDESIQNGSVISPDYFIIPHHLLYTM